jgi:hypothetical protein
MLVMRTVSKSELADRVSEGAIVEVKMRKAPASPPAFQDVGAGITAGQIAAMIDASTQRTLKAQADLITGVLKQLAALRDAQGAPPKKLVIHSYRNDADELCAEVTVIE